MNLTYNFWIHAKMNHLHGIHDIKPETIYRTRGKNIADNLCLNIYNCQYIKTKNAQYRRIHVNDYRIIMIKAKIPLRAVSRHVIITRTMGLFRQARDLAPSLAWYIQTNPRHGSWHTGLIVLPKILIMHNNKK